MAIREKLKKTFGRKKEGKDGVSGSSTPSTSSEKHFTGRTDIEYYKPHEIPKSKYRGKVDPEHKETLESYSFADALASMRRRSSQALSGIVSPGGTKSQSRRPSYMSRASSTDVRSNNFAGSENVPSRQNTTTTASHLPPGMALVRENSDDDTDPVNAGLSRHVTMNNNNNNNSSLNKELRTETELDRQETVRQEEPRLPATSPTHEQPFTPDELTQAMSRVALQTHKDEDDDHHRLRSSTAISAH